MQKKGTLFVTGHRWHKLPFGTDESDLRCKALVGVVTRTLTEQIEAGISHVICGMALGFDTLVAEAFIRLQAAYPHVTLEAALICPGQSGKWQPSRWQHLESILEFCLSPSTITRPVYVTVCEIARNRHLVGMAPLPPAR